MGDGIVANFDISIIVLPIIAVALVAVAFFKIRELKKVQSELNSAIVLVPLYKRKIVLFVSTVLLLLLTVFCVKTMIEHGFVVQFISLIVCILSVVSIFIKMINCKFAVLSTGALLPYKFVEWGELHDYIIDGNKIIFTGNGLGRYTLSSTTVKMKFNEVDLKKLEKVLTKNKHK